MLAVDASAAMLTAARTAVKDQRVRWLRLSAERLDTCVSGDIDAVLCNSAIWQTDVRATIAAVARALRPAGRFVFNIGAEMLADHADPGFPPNPLRSGNFNKMSAWPYAARSIGAEGLHFHDLRHTGNTFAERRGVASNATFPGRPDGAIRNTEPCSQTTTHGGWREPAGQHGPVRTRLQQA